jgi:hypothetical protein
VIVLAVVVPAAGLMLLLGMDQLETRLLGPDPASRPLSIAPPNDTSPAWNRPPIIQQLSMDATGLPHIGDNATRAPTSVDTAAIRPRVGRWTHTPATLTRPFIEGPPRLHAERKRV